MHFTIDPNLSILVDYPKLKSLKFQLSNKILLTLTLKKRAYHLMTHSIDYPRRAGSEGGDGGLASRRIFTRRSCGLGTTMERSHETSRGGGSVRLFVWGGSHILHTPQLVYTRFEQNTMFRSKIVHSSHDNKIKTMN